MWFTDTGLRNFLCPSFAFNKMYTQVQFSDPIVLSELRCTDTYAWLSVHYITLPKCIYKTESEHLRGATLTPSSNTADLFRVEIFLAGYFF